MGRDFEDLHGFSRTDRGCSGLPLVTLSGMQGDPGALVPMPAGLDLMARRPSPGDVVVVERILPTPIKNTPGFGVSEEVKSCAGRNRTYDLQVMSLAS
jgi:hypothetical protein